MLNERRKQGYGIILVTEKAPHEARDLITWLKLHNVPYDVIVFGGGDAEKAYALTMQLARTLNTDVAEVHTRSTKICDCVRADAKMGVYYWYGPNQYMFVIPRRVDVKEIKENYEKVRDSQLIDCILKNASRPYTVQYMGYAFKARDGLEALAALYYINDVIHKVNPTSNLRLSGSREVELIKEKLRLARAAKEAGIDVDEYKDENLPLCIIRGKKVPAFTNKLKNLDELLSEKRIREEIRRYYRLPEIEGSIASNFVDVDLTSLNESNTYRGHLLLSALHVRRTVEEPEKPDPDAVLGKINTLDDVGKNMNTLRELTNYTAYNLSDEYAKNIGDLKLIVKMGAVQIQKTYSLNENRLRDIIEKTVTEPVEGILELQKFANEEREKKEGAGKDSKKSRARTG